jgi:two-component sensor histidine kinase
LAGEPKWWDVVVSPIYGSNGKPERLLAVSRDVTDHKHAEQQRELLLAELSHRVKNTLATVVSIARQSLTKHKNLDEARLSFEARIRALAQTHTRLAESNWAGVALETIIWDELAPYRREDTQNVRMSGPPVSLNPKFALMIGMAMHELATNAAKYGALSAKSGVVETRWEIEKREAFIHISWTERGGPAVLPPTRQGFGRLLLERALGADTGGKVAMHFDQDGLKCNIAVPLAESTMQ